MALSSPLDRHILSIQFFPILSKLHAAPGMTSFLLLLWLLHLRHRQQLPGPFDKGAELLWQVPIQKIHHRTDPIQEPIREAALLLQLLFQALHLYQQLSVLVFKPLPNSVPIVTVALSASVEPYVSPSQAALPNRYTDPTFKATARTG